jgi:hypothetical protein
MSTDLTSREQARQAVELYNRGIICASEVWHLFVDHATAETFAEFMAELTPELQDYFHGHILVHRPINCHLDEERQALVWLSDYYETHRAYPRRSNGGTRSGYPPGQLSILHPAQID